MAENESPITDNIEETGADPAAPVPDSANPRKHKKYRYRRTGDARRKLLVVSAVIGFWAALLLGWYLIVTIEAR
jgi:hypothetical protein